MLAERREPPPDARGGNAHDVHRAADGADEHPGDEPAVGRPRPREPAGVVGCQPDNGFGTEQCRLDPGCPSSEHRTSDPCGAELIADVEAYLDGRRDAEQGRPFHADDGRAGYAQGWCDGGGS
jgi:hypothetical protein